MADDEAVRALVALGFTGLEAEVYACLARESPATGYRVAQTLGKPVAGIYKTIESLVNKGAVMVEEGASRLCRAMPPDELLGRLERHFRERKSAAERALAELPGAPEDDRVYQLRSLDQVFERGRAMIEAAERLVVVDGFLLPLERLRPELEGAAARGVRVAVLTYEAAEFAGARMIRFGQQNHPLITTFPGSWLNLVVDGSELLLAFFTRPADRLQLAVWSRSPFLAWSLHAYMISEFNYLTTLNDPDTPPETRRVAQRHRRFFPLDVPGYQRLLQRLGLPDTPLPPWPDLVPAETGSTP
jgi:sugar-specific transcriptional regulator TrmB